MGDGGGGTGEGGGFIWVSVEKEEGSIASNKVWSGNILSQWRKVGETIEILQNLVGVLGTFYWDTTKFPLYPPPPPRRKVRTSPWLIISVKGDVEKNVVINIAIKRKKIEKTLTLCLTARGDWCSYTMLFPGDSSRNHRRLLCCCWKFPFGLLNPRFVHIANFPSNSMDQINYAWKFEDYVLERDPLLFNSITQNNSFSRVSKSPSPPPPSPTSGRLNFKCNQAASLLTALRLLLNRNIKGI